MTAIIITSSNEHNRFKTKKKADRYYLSANNKVWIGIQPIDVHAICIHTNLESPTSRYLAPFYNFPHRQRLQRVQGSNLNARDMISQLPSHSRCQSEGDNLTSISIKLLFHTLWKYFHNSQAWSRTMQHHYIQRYPLRHQLPVIKKYDNLLFFKRVQTPFILGCFPPATWMRWNRTTDVESLPQIHQFLLLLPLQSPSNLFLFQRIVYARECSNSRIQTSRFELESYSEHDN